MVGPDYIQILHGSLFEQEISLILCGESHQDAIDVTRRDGKFDGEEGWIDRIHADILAPFKGEDVQCRILDSTKKGLPLQKAKEWGKNRIEESEDGYMVTLVLLWVQEQEGGRVSKGKAHIVEITTKDKIGEEDKEKGDGGGDDEDSEYEDEHWINPKEDTDEILPYHVRNWVLGQPLKGNPNVQSLEWGDLDAQAFALNQRRLTDEEISTEELDNIVRQRKQKLKDADNIWTWDDWFAHLQNKGTENEMSVDLILEASVPPWELDLHRPSPGELVQIRPAADCFRKMEADEDPDEEDDFDPSNDGIGSYLDHFYRRFMVEQLSTKGNMDRLETKWLHCVDGKWVIIIGWKEPTVRTRHSSHIPSCHAFPNTVRDLGCESAVHTDAVKKKWYDILHEEEHLFLDTSNNVDTTKTSFLELEPNSSNDYIKFVPEPRMNPEKKFVHTLRAEERLDNLEAFKEEEKEQKEDGNDGQDFSYPSIEGFLGQNSDFLYYSKHVKVCYSPFMVKCVQSLDKWDNFFETLFFGGNIPDALSRLQLEGNTEYMYVRSQVRDLNGGKYAYREDGEEYISYPFFPFQFYLCAKGTSQTWISALFDRLVRHDPTREFSLAVKEWWLNKIHRTMKDPKGADDPDCGGEWFEAYLYAVHREIYEDIDRSDATKLLKKNKVKSLTTGRKYDIGSIQIPSCQDGFAEMIRQFSPNRIDPKAEVLAKILIDIYTSCLLDIAVALKVAEIAKDSDKKKIVIVLYMGSAHTKEVSQFFVDKFGFKKKAFIGKMEYEEDDNHKLQLPSSLWNPSELFATKS